MRGRRASAVAGLRRQPPPRLQRYWHRASEREGGTPPAVARTARAMVAEAELAVSCLLATIVAAAVEGAPADELRRVAQSANAERAHLYRLWDELDRLDAAPGRGAALEDDWRDLGGQAAQSRARAEATEARVPRDRGSDAVPRRPRAQRSRPRSHRRRGARD